GILPEFWGQGFVTEAAKAVLQHGFQVCRMHSVVAATDTPNQASVRVLHSFHDPAFGFEQFFELDLLRTQYLTYYLAAHLLAYPFGVALGNKLLLAAVLLGTPCSVRYLLGALGRDRRVAFLALPLTYNAHLVLGFFNFIAAIPLTFVGLALAVEQRKRPRPGREALLSVLLLLAFFTHVVPFGFLAVGALLVAVGDGARQTLRRLAPLGPAAAGAVFWALRSPAGQATVHAASGAGTGGGPRPLYQSPGEALRQLASWLTDVLPVRQDEQLLEIWAGLLILTFVFGAVQRRGGPGDPPPPAALQRSLARRLWLLPLLAAVSYFAFPVSYDWIWPIAQRFPLLAALFLLPVVPSPRRRAAELLAAAVLLVSASSFFLVGRAFYRFDRDEVGEFDAALEVIPPGQRVAGLIFDRGSRQVRFSPFIHFVAYYQARRGGAVMFTFADFPVSPFRFREQNRPPRVRPRWEWTPERVNPARDLGWYRYVLVRGRPGVIDRQRRYYEPVHRSAHWSVWRRRER
ncbi:MAG: GNAT family N-acetyltransferase; N-acetyltransferase, partial [Anaerolineae bacterium]